MSSLLSIAISSLALLVSVTTAYFTLFRRGRLRATWPAVVFFGPDGPPKDASNRVYLRTLLFSTSRRGHVVESMHVTLTRGESRQNFNIWVYGEDRLSRGSGLFVGEQGFAANHYFLLPPDGAPYAFVSGTYELRLFAKCVGDRAPRELVCLRLVVTESQGAALQKTECGVYFDWGPDQQAYLSHIRERPELDVPKKLLESAG